QAAASQPIAFLVGMAGRSHWSASIQAIAAEAAFHFDLAVRIGTPPKFVGSSYRTMVDALLRDVGSAIIDVDNLRCEFVVTDTQLAQLESTPDGISLHCLESPNTFPTTLRWKYTIRLAVNGVFSN